MDPAGNSPVDRRATGTRWWGEQGIELVVALPAAPEVSLPTVQTTPVRDFSQLELRSFLKAHGHDWTTVAHDVRRLIVRPALAKLYLEVSRHSLGYQPETEYALVQAAWNRDLKPLTAPWRAARATLGHSVAASSSMCGQ